MSRLHSIAELKVKGKVKCAVCGNGQKPHNKNSKRKEMKKRESSAVEVAVHTIGKKASSRAQLSSHRAREFQCASFSVERQTRPESGAVDTCTNRLHDEFQNDR